ncbi:MAG: bifunctional diaminohydroxyphosphoribosylaminopyrimidine deaminase/5-amino-6-(5-phosphoribosylamino)uracil reductase RibD [Planctomycetota bacterium]
MTRSADESYMLLACSLAMQGEGNVEPNPMVGCVLVKDHEVIASGYHEKFGQAHAEINAIHTAHRNGHRDLTNATAYVTLEPCSHFGKTGPCSDALIQAGIKRVVVAVTDPNPVVAGKGIEKLRAAGIEVELGVLQEESANLLSPYLKKLKTGQPWIIAKWAMTLDGKIAAVNGDSKWISSESSRQIVHQLRGRVDGVMVGIGTAIVDDPRLDARPPGVRVATRIVVDSFARIDLGSHLVQTANTIPVLISVGPTAEESKIEQLTKAGCQVFQSDFQDRNARLQHLLQHLGKLGMTNILVEGGEGILGALHDLGQIDEAHVFVCPKLVGGTGANSPVGGIGKQQMLDATRFEEMESRKIENDIYLWGRLKR